MIEYFCWVALEFLTYHQFRCFGSLCVAEEVGLRSLRPLRVVLLQTLATSTVILRAFQQMYLLYTIRNRTHKSFLQVSNQMLLLVSQGFSLFWLQDLFFFFGGVLVKGSRPFWMPQAKTVWINTYASLKALNMRILVIMLGKVLLANVERVHHHLKLFLQIFDFGLR